MVIEFFSTDFRRVLYKYQFSRKFNQWKLNCFRVERVTLGFNYSKLEILRFRLSVLLLLLVSIDRLCMKVLTGAFIRKTGFSFHNITV